MAVIKDRIRQHPAPCRSRAHMRAAGSGDAAILRDADLVVSGLNRLPPVVSVPTVPAA